MRQICLWSESDQPLTCEALRCPASLREGSISRSVDIDPFVSLFFLTLWQNNTCSRLQLSIHSSIFFQLQDSEAFINPPVSSGSPPSWTLQRKFLLAACNYNFVDCFGLPGCLGASLQPCLCYFVLYPALGCIVRVHVTR